MILKEKTAELIAVARRQPRKHLALSGLESTKDGKKLLRQQRRQRKALADSLRAKRAEHGAWLARVWHRAGGK